MIRKVAGEVNSKLTLKLLFLWLVILIGVISFAVYRSQNFTLRYSLDYFTFTISDVIPVIFPIIAVLIYVVSFSEEIRNRFIVYTRLRRGILETLYIKLVANIILSCLFYFTLIFVVFIFAYYIEPQLGIATYDLEGYGLSPETAKEDASNRHTFTQLLAFGPLIYGILYSLWVGLNAALYSTLGFFLVILVRNRFLALSLPFIIYLVGSFALAALDLPIYRLNHSVFPFDRIQNDIWQAFIPFAFLVLLTVALFIYVRKNISRVGSLT